MPDRKAGGQADTITAKQIAQKISAQGPMSIADYMRIANLAYYNNRDPLGVDGDFTTSPEISQMFGELIGLWMTDLWFRKNSPLNANYIELGPGRGTLAADILRSTKKFDFRPSPYFVETSETLRAAQAAAVPNAHFCTSIDDIPNDGPLFIVANEFFDALPIRQFIATHSGWRERVVASDKGNKFIAMPSTVPMDSFIPPDIRNAPVDTIYETNPETSNIVYELVNRVKDQGGVILIVDYGYDAAGHGNTLQAVSQHKYASPFEDPGQRDLTAHVNFMEIVNIAHMRGMQIMGPIGQGDWLENLGINVRAENLIASAPDLAEDINNARIRLTSEDEMGCLFKVLAIAHPDWPKAEGFNTQIPKMEIDTPQDIVHDTETTDRL